MLASMLTVMVLAAAPAKIAAPEWTAVNVSKELVAFYSDDVARVLRSEGLEVVTARDIATVLGMERQKQLLGCTDDSSGCMTELGAALGCDGILVGNLARLDGSFRGSVKVLSARDGKTLVDEPVTASSEKEVADALERAAERIARVLLKRGGGEVRVEASVESSSGLRSYSWIPAVSGALLAAGAIASFTIAGNDSARIPNVDELTAKGLASDGRGFQAAGWGLAIGAGVAFLAGGLMYWLGAPSGLTPQLSMSGSRVSVGLAGAFP